jgi:hypothetical protein
MGPGKWEEEGVAVELEGTALERESVGVGIDPEVDRLLG